MIYKTRVRAYQVDMGLILNKWSNKNNQSTQNLVDRMIHDPNTWNRDYSRQYYRNSQIVPAFLDFPWVKLTDFVQIGQAKRLQYTSSISNGMYSRRTPKLWNK